MTAVSRYADLPPSTPVLRRSLRHVGTMPEQTPSDRANATIGDSPLPPAPVSHFLGEAESESEAPAPLISATSHAHSNITHPRARSYRISSEAQRETHSDPYDDSPGTGRRAVPASLQRDELQHLRASSIFREVQTQEPLSRSSPFASAAALHHDDLRSKSSPPSRAAKATLHGSASPLYDGGELRSSAALPNRRRSNEKADEEEEKKVRYAPIEDRTSVKRDTPDEVVPRAASSSSAAAAASSSVQPSSGYRTPAMAGRALRSSAAAAPATAQRSAARSLRTLTRSSNRHPPARRVVRRYSDDEDDDLEDEGGAGVNGANKSREEVQSASPGNGHNQDASSNSGSGSGSGYGSGPGAGPGSAEAVERPDRRFLPYGYDAEKEKIRAEMMERASLVRSPGPESKPSRNSDNSAEAQDQDYDMQPPPPRRNEAHPFARKA
ncbi:hypothetical protein, partial [Sporisorium scitamineum]